MGGWNEGGDAEEKTNAEQEINYSEGDGSMAGAASHNQVFRLECISL